MVRNILMGAALTACSLNVSAANDEQTFGKKTIHMQPGQTLTVQVSSLMLNEIITPFKNPKAITGSKATITEDGNSYFIKPKLGEPFIQLMIKNEEKPSHTYQVILLPAQDIPGQTIELIASDSDLKGGDDLLAMDAPVSSDYMDELRELLRSAAKGETPRGFQESNDFRGAPLQVGGLFAEAMKRYVGAYYTVEVFIVTNRGNQTIIADEAAFASEGTKAAALYPKLNLMPGEVTQLFRIQER